MIRCNPHTRPEPEPNADVSKIFAAGYILAMRQIIADLLGLPLEDVVESTIEDDLQCNTDLRILRAGGLRIGCRVRKAFWFHHGNARHEFTVRSWRPAGFTTELIKILAGWGDLFLYGFAHDTQPGQLQAWFVGRYDVFRHWFYNYVLDHGDYPVREQSPKTKDARFLAIPKAMLPSHFFVAEHPRRNQETPCQSIILNSISYSIYPPKPSPDPGPVSISCAATATPAM